MAQINLLNSKVYNRIAAGEVVERPASVVKELVENAIDAGANSITISIIGGGRVSICVTDNGGGIEKSELKKALLPHATSKISKASDLDNILTLGFRGEALASISAVSKTTICSKPKNQAFGAKITCDGGNFSDVVDCALSDGTEITVDNLFYNTPAREKFLKSDKSEENEISLTVARFILGNPFISFTFSSDGNILMQSFGDGLESAVVCVYGANAIKECHFINVEKNGINITGYICKPDFSKGTRNNQTVFLNGRYIVNQTISSAISNAYSPYLMKRRYPYYVLLITMPTDAVDCNTHPNKTDVRFINNQIVYGALYTTFSKVLDGNVEALNIVVEKSIDLPEKTLVKNKYDEKAKYTYPETRITFDKIVFEDSAKSIKPDFSKIENKETATDIFAENKAFLQQLEIKKQENIVKQEQIDIIRELRYIGQALSTYLIFDDGENVYMVDQHAAHERILYDKFYESFTNTSLDVQPLLIPYVQSFNSVEFEFLNSNLDIINGLGIEVSEFGVNTLKISAVPLCLSGIDLNNFFKDILDDIQNLRAISLPNLLKEKIAQKACKASIKAGDKLSDEDIKCLIQKLNGNLGLKCPHGRPITVKISKLEIEKWFKRIV